MVTSGSQWISSNLSITGFSEGNSAFMTCKELIENSLDATNTQESPSLLLHIEEVGGFLDVCCRDNGCGFRVDSVEALVSVFQSSKMSESAGSIGTFGVGLKAMALMSHRICQGSRISISSPVLGTPSVVSFDLGVGDSGDIEIFGAVLTEGEALTAVTVRSPRPSCWERFFNDIREYISELAISRPGLHIGLSVNDEDPIVFESGLPQGSVAHKDASGVADCSVSISCDSSNTKKVVIVRSVNGVPLLTQSMQACMVYLSIVGCLTKVCTSLGVEMSNDNFSPSIISACHNLTSTPQGSSWNSLTIRLNIVPHNGQKVEYGSLLKDSISGFSGSSASLPTIVSRTVKSALKKIQSQFRNEFQSIHDYEHACALRTYIPVIAHHLSAAANRVEDESNRARLTDLFGSLDQDTVESKIKSILIHSIGSL